MPKSVITVVAVASPILGSFDREFHVLRPLRGGGGRMPPRLLLVIPVSNLGRYARGGTDGIDSVILGTP